MSRERKHSNFLPKGLKKKLLQPKSGLTVALKTENSLNATPVNFKSVDQSVKQTEQAKAAKLLGMHLDQYEEMLLLGMGVEEYKQKIMGLPAPGAPTSKEAGSTVKPGNEEPNTSPFWKSPFVIGGGVLALLVVVGLVVYLIKNR